MENNIKILEEAINVAVQRGCYSFEDVIKINEALQSLKNPQLSGKPKDLQHK